MYLDQFYEGRKNQQRVESVQKRLEQEQVKMFSKYQSDHHRLREYFETLLRNDLDNSQILA
jgi:hypothetical protein